MIRQVRDFIADQVRKTIRRPSRLFIVPYHIIRFILRPIVRIILAPDSVRVPLIRFRAFLIHALAEFLLGDNAVATYIFPIAKRWFPTPTLALAARHYFQLAHQQLDANEPDAAWRNFRSCLKFSSEPVHFFAAAICLMVGLGRFNEAMTLFTRANMLLLERAKFFGIADSKLRFLEHFWVGGFGHLAQMDYFVKYEILEGRTRADSVLYIPRGFSVPNKFLLDLWRPFLEVVEDEAELPVSLGALSTLSYNFLAPRLFDRSTVHLWEIGAKTYQRWEDEKREPLLNLSPEVERRGWQVLENKGIPRDAWFTVLHVREAGSRKYHADLHNVLNADIFNYMPAIEEITRRGGWVIRMGDPSMKALPAAANVFDYCQSEDRSDWMDIFLCASARFFIGTSSGPAYVPTDFGVPCVHTNWWPPAQRPWHSRDIFIPKLYRKIDSGNVLTLSQSLREPFGYCNSIAYLKKTQGVEVLDNSSEDIRDATIEMLDRLENKTDYDEGDMKLREAAQYIYQSNNVHGAALLTRSFLKRHTSLLK
jgi:putative glycosyltransferase (TIGR04372 family)